MQRHAAILLLSGLIVERHLLPGEQCMLFHLNYTTVKPVKLA